MDPKPAGRAVTVLTGTLTVSGSSNPAVGFEGTSKLVAQLEVTAASGVGPTLDVVLEDSVDGVNWNTVDTFAQAVAVGRSVRRITVPFTDRLRARYTIAGTSPSFTASVKVYAEA